MEMLAKLEDWNFLNRGIVLEWKSKIDECCADELEEMIIDKIKAGFLSNDEILEECEEYMEDYYPDDYESITDNELLEIIERYRKKFRNTAEFLKIGFGFQ